MPRKVINYQDYFHWFYFLELRDAFNIFDRDRNGIISLAEFVHVLITLNWNPTDKLVQKIMKEMDIDDRDSGKLDHRVFVFI